MKTTYFGLCTAIVLVLTVVPVRAQVARGDVMLDRLASGLELTDSQKAAVKESGAASDPGAALWDVAATLQRVLTDEQTATLLERGKTAQAYGRGLRAGVRTAERRNMGTRQRASGVRFQRQRAHEGISDLSNDQKEAMGELREGHGERMRTLRAEAREEDLDRVEIAAKARALSESHHEEMLTILTDEQREQFETRPNAARTGSRAVRGQQRNSQTGMRGARHGQGSGVRGHVRQNSQPQRGRAIRSAARPAVMGQRASSRANGMAEALELSDGQQELLQIHQALTAGLAARQIGARASRGAARSGRRGR